MNLLEGCVHFVSDWIDTLKITNVVNLKCVQVTYNYTIMLLLLIGPNFCVAANLVLHRTIERIHVGKKYGDIPRGVFIVRGENVVLLGEVVSVIYFFFFFSFY